MESVSVAPRLDCITTRVAMAARHDLVRVPALAGSFAGKFRILSEISIFEPVRIVA
jgi:hypothetical protein